MKYRPLGDFVKLSQGLAINSGTKHFVSEKKDEEFIYPLLRIADMMENTFTKYISKNVNPTVIANEDDIIYTRTGQIGLAFRGYKGVVHNNSFIVSLISDQLDKDYLFALLQSSFVREQALKLAKNSVQPDLTHDMFKSIMIPMPTMSVQKKIAKMYSDISDKIENNNKINAELESMAKTIYDYWFLQFEFPNEDGKPYKSSGGKMVWNEELKREIPEEWKVSQLKDKYSIKRGISYTSKDIESGDGVPMINLACIDINRNYRNGELKYYNGKVTDSSKLDSEDLLIACTDLTRNADIVGSPILTPSDNKTYTYSMDIAKLIPDDRYFNRFYLYMTLRTDFYHNYIKKWASGTNVLHLNLDGISWYKTWIPPIEIQNKFALIIENIHKKKCEILSENQELASLRDFLLPMLMNGQVGFK